MPPGEKNFNVRIPELRGDRRPLELEREGRFRGGPFLGEGPAGRSLRINPNDLKTDSKRLERLLDGNRSDLPAISSTGHFGENAQEVQGVSSRLRLLSRVLSLLLEAWGEREKKDAAPVTEGREGSSPYTVKEKNYFDWAVGIRAPDKYRRVAERFFERIQGMSSRGQVKEVKEESVGLAEETRRKLALLLHCSPENILLGNSATQVGLLIAGGLMLMQRRSDPEGTGLANHIFYPLLSQYPLLSWAYFGRKKLVDLIVTRQNFEHPGDMFRQIERLKYLEFFRRYFAIPFGHANPAELMTHGKVPLPISVLDSAPGGPVLHSTGEADRRAFEAMREGSVRPVVMAEHLDRFLGVIYKNEFFERLGSYVQSKVGSPDKPLLFLDASHSAGSVDFDVTSLADACIGSSCKFIGGEPTIGFGYVSDELMPWVEAAARQVFPRISLQFGPDSPLGSRSPDELDERGDYWISLPELASFNAALGDLLEVGIASAAEKCMEMKRRVEAGAAGSRRSFGKKFSPFVSMEIGEGIGMGAGFPFTEEYSRAYLPGGDFFGMGEDSPYFIDAPHYLTFQGDPSLARELEGRGFFVSVIERDRPYFLEPDWRFGGGGFTKRILVPSYVLDHLKGDLGISDMAGVQLGDLRVTGGDEARCYFDDALGPVVRISFRHDVPQDIEGLLLALKKPFSR